MTVKKKENAIAGKTIYGMRKIENNVAEKVN